MKFCCNINWLFREHDFADRFSVAAAAGFQAVEFHHPEDCLPGQVIEKAAEAGVTIALFNAWPGDFIDGGPGLSGVPGREDQFAQAVRQAAGFGTAIGGGAVVQVGPCQVPQGVSRDECLALFIQNMEFASNELAKANCKVMIEPMNRSDFPDILIADIDTALEVIDAVTSDNIGLQFDCYHTAMNGDDVIESIRRIHHQIDHLQFSDAPGRGEPGSGSLDMQAIFEVLDEVGYRNYVAAEYQPTGSSEDSLSWLHTYHHLSSV